MQIKAVLKKGIDILKERENALLECEILLSHILSVDKEYLILNPEQALSEEFVNLFFKYVERVKEGEPISYITNEKEFYGFDFFVDNRVLIPRPETEFLVERSLKFLDKNFYEGKIFKILDIGTGSCNIPIAIAKNFSDVSILALDIDENALEVAKINIEQHGLEDKIQIALSNLLEVLEDGEEFDLITANLPYIGEKTNRYVESAVEKYEPNKALFAGDDGLVLYKKLFQQLKDKNIKFNLLIGEFGFGQIKGMEELLNKYFEQSFVIEKDFSEIPRIFIVNKA